MSRTWVVLLLVVAALQPGVAAESGGSRPRIVAVAPNPVADGDAGEFVVVEFPGETNLTGWTLADGETTVRFPDRTVAGRIAFAADPRRARNATDHPVYRVDGSLALANGGERIELRYDGQVVDALAYRDAPEGEVGRRTDAGLRWRPVGATDFDVVRARGGRVRAFVLPDGAAVPAEVLAGADRRVFLAAYTLTSRRVVSELARKARRGVVVRVLVEGGPVGGMTRRQARLLDRLSAAGAGVTVVDEPRARYAFHHAKYAVVDDRAVVLTENWKPAGTGGRSSRGWGVVVTQRTAVERLAAVFRADSGWRDGVPWTAFRAGREFEPPGAASGTYPERFSPARVRVESVAVLVAPDNAERGLVSLLDGANESIEAIQVSLGGRRQPFVRAVLRAARRGVRVRVLLSDARYVSEDNAELVAWLAERARREDLPLTAKLASPNGRFEKVHAKGVIVDGERVVLGSLNWNNHSARANREVAVVLGGEAVAGYYRRVFRADWRGGLWELPVGFGGVVALAAAVAVLVGRRIGFETHRDGNPAESDPPEQ
ncbi:phospholipase [Halobacteriales archaeon QS_1_68_17]|nr:MAG: phospholipase [Halobacteriales archaeon QS_1_68_17]